ncbi:RDS3 complex subunit 10 [Trichomonascus vanleenenianus]|uniref:U2 snRNP complex subunit YSF3 n=1 Tax=Trichomonascus vanleenenianus TaxID=2268995 RepID=UPI003EC9D30D
MDRLRDQQRFEQLQTRYIGVGHPDITKEEWQTNVARDTYASFIGHPPMLEQFSIALGESRVETQMRFIDSMIQPVKKAKE